MVSYNATTFHDRDRKLQGVFAAARDVTERKRFEHALQENNVELERATAAAEKANLAKSDFLSSMSHELRSPLNAILGFAQLMISDTHRPPPPGGEHQSCSPRRMVSAGTDRQILDRARSNPANAGFIKERRLLADRVMLECQAMIEPQAQKRGITMTFPHPRSPIFVDADRTRLKQVIINLLSNAIKYNRNNGTVVVDCTMTAKERIRVSVRDTGAGLPPEMLDQLFQPFNRLGQERSAVEVHRHRAGDKQAAD